MKLNIYEEPKEVIEALGAEVVNGSVCPHCEFPSLKVVLIPRISQAFARCILCGLYAEVKAEISEEVPKEDKSLLLKKLLAKSLPSPYEAAMKSNLRPIPLLKLRAKAKEVRELMLSQAEVVK